MPLQTTVIGAYPKPDYLDTPDWFRTRPSKYSAKMFNDKQKDPAYTKDAEALEMKAIKEVLDEQTDIGISVITDGEIARENYIFHFCRHLDGFSFENIVTKPIRNGASQLGAPSVVSLLEAARPGFCAKDWSRSQSLTKTPVKYTLPGPMTIINSTNNAAYGSSIQESADLVAIINKEILALCEAGCKHIQIDEPLMVRQPEIALEYGIDHLSECFEGVGSDVQKAVHLCCGYPSYLDQQDYEKADREEYFELADKLDNAGIDAFSIEDAHLHNDLTLLDHFKKSSIILGVVTIAQSKVETVEEIQGRVKEALKHLPPERLILAPDCGLGFLPRDILRQKLNNMVKAAGAV